MDCSQLNGQCNVAELLICRQEVIPVFLRHRMACVGCLMAPFETLEGAAANYALDLESFLTELEQASSSRVRQACSGGRDSIK